MSVDAVVAGAAAALEAQGRGFLAGKFPYGECEVDGCEKAACHAVTDEEGARLVCRHHKPEGIFFAPFLGQQTKIFETTCRYVLAGGGAGGSKTYGGARLWLKQWIVEQQRFEAGEITASTGHFLFLRRTIPAVTQVIQDFKTYYKRVDPGASWNEQKSMCRFTNGYTVQFGGMEDDDSWQKYWGSAYSLLVFDEAVEFTVQQIEKLDERIRSADPVLGGMLQLYLLTNPIAIAQGTKQYLKRRFVDVAEPEEEVKIETKLADGRVVEDWQVYIPSNVFDNPALMEDGKYEATLRRRSTATLRALLYNDWNVDEGAWVGEDWDPSVHVVEPFEIPRGWAKLKFADYGFSSRSSVMWAAMDPDGNMIVYRALSTRGKTVEELGYLIRELESQPYHVKVNGKRIYVTEAEWDTSNDCSTVFGPMDSALWARVGEAASISRGEVLDTIGCGFFKSSKDPDAAAEQIRQRLRRRTPTGDGQTEVPGLRFFSTCKSRIKTKDGFEEVGPLASIPACPADPNNPDRWDTKADDHDLDALGYGCLSRPLAGEHDAVVGEQAGIVYQLLKYRKQQASGSAFPEWYRNANH